MRFDEHVSDMRDGDLVHPPRSAAGYRAWAEQEAVRDGGDEFRLAVEVGGELVGSLSAFGVDARAGRFGYGIGIGREHQRRGYAAEAVVLLLGFMFGERRMHKCEVSVHAFNEASIALHEKLGFRREGVLRDHEFFAGRHHDVVLFGLTAAEFATRHPFRPVR
ncbi:GNAT family N-acetyltransferase [Saccharothrix sp. SC076]|nr:GNAT family N-acetyltransferase [Saccharothrix obliqua]